MFIIYYTMHLLNIDASPTQLRKLRNGHQVRIKKGTGFNLIVHPSTYHLVSRAFNKGKGSQIKLSREEIGANQEASRSPDSIKDIAKYTSEQTGNEHPISGKGIFGSKFDRFLKKTGLNKITDTVGTIAKPFVQQVIKQILGKVPIVGDKLAGLANAYIDDPSRFQKGGVSEVARNLMTGEGMRGYGMPRGCGVNSGYMAKAGYGKAMADQERALMTNQAIRSREARQSGGMYDSDPTAPRSRGYGIQSHHAITGRGGGMIDYTPPALVSQPYSANYQMSHFLPVQYQMYNSSMHEPFSRHPHNAQGEGVMRIVHGEGMYAGAGLYAGRGF